jgi:Raf kinase inhibitor-like YbhB/YbcL family protein
MSFKLHSPALTSGQSIPTRYTGDGADLSPPLQWDGAPAETRQFALVCDDPDAPTPQPWVHWVLYHIPPTCHELPEGLSQNAALTQSLGVRQGRNSWPSGKTTGYRGPAPPRGHGVHHYHFRLYALDRELDLPEGLTSEQLRRHLQGHILATAELVGTYSR